VNKGKKSGLNLMDSVTRVAMGPKRRLGLATGEPPTTKRYLLFPVFTTLPKVNGTKGYVQKTGSITAFYTVLVEGG